MHDPKNITETTTLAELREQRLLLGIIALRVYPPGDSEDPVAASVHHATGFYVGTGPTEATRDRGCVRQAPARTPARAAQTVPRRDRKGDW